MSKVFEDERGFFAEVYNESKAKPAQVNVSYSKKGVVRGLHWQEPYVEKTTWVLKGKLLAVAYNLVTGDTRKKILTPNSGTFTTPKGWANGNQALEDTVFAYTMDGVYNPDGDRGINPYVFDWILEPIVSEKDRNAPTKPRIG